MKLAIKAQGYSGAFQGLLIVVYIITAATTSIWLVAKALNV